MPQTALKRKYNYRRRLPHYQKEDTALFVTFRAGCCKPLPESVRDIVLQHCLHDHGTKVHVHAAVVMPDHVHILLTPLRDGDGSAAWLRFCSLSKEHQHTVSIALFDGQDRYGRRNCLTTCSD